eukprot:527261-Hanusia_phi.AAC.1
MYLPRTSPWKNLPILYSRTARRLIPTTTRKQTTTRTRKRRLRRPRRSTAEGQQARTGTG